MDKKKIRCAIYTRKSTEEGLEQDFNSLDAQREACEAYINRKEQIIRDVANEYKNIIPEIAYNALMNYKMDVDRFMEKSY